MDDLLGCMKESGATFSPCRAYRYTLWRCWDDIKGFAMFVGLNPSTADEAQDDPTIRRCISFAKDWGYGALCMTNLFAFRATDPTAMKRERDPIGPDNDFWLKACADTAALRVAVWGTHGTHLSRDAAVLAMLPELHILKATKDGHPGHPLYLPKTLKPIKWMT